MLFLCNLKHMLIVYLVRHLSNIELLKCGLHKNTHQSELRDEGRRKETTLQLYL